MTPGCVKCKMAFFTKHKRMSNHISNLPVSIWSNLLNSCLPACQEFLRIGHIKEVILHINRWGGGSSTTQTLCLPPLTWTPINKKQIRISGCENNKRTLLQQNNCFDMRDLWMYENVHGDFKKNIGCWTDCENDLHRSADLHTFTSRAC